VRERREHQLCAGEWCVVVRDEPNVEPTEPRAFPAPLIRSGESELQVRVTRDDAAQLATRIAARTEYPYRNSMHD
jgi:hypothetical protein